MRVSIVRQKFAQKRNARTLESLVRRSEAYQEETRDKSGLFDINWSYDFWSVPTCYYDIMSCVIRRCAY
eukprot:8191196-Pyramimonas_sp.AAC.1